jgi:hypothetical protein
MRRRLVVFLAVLVALHTWQGVSMGRDVKVRMKRGKGAPTRQAEVPDMRKAFKQVVQGMEKIEGLFTFYWDKESGKLYMEIKPDQLDVIYLCSITREAGDGQFFTPGPSFASSPSSSSRSATRFSSYTRTSTSARRRGRRS